MFFLYWKRIYVFKSKLLLYKKELYFTRSIHPFYIMIVDHSNPYSDPLSRVLDQWAYGSQFLGSKLRKRLFFWFLGLRYMIRS